MSAVTSLTSLDALNKLLSTTQKLVVVRSPSSSSTPTSRRFALSRCSLTLLDHADRLHSNMVRTLRTSLFLPLFSIARSRLSIPQKAISPVYEKLANQYRNVTFLKVDVDAAQDIAKAYGVRSFPFFSPSPSFPFCLSMLTLRSARSLLCRPSSLSKTRARSIRFGELMLTRAFSPFSFTSPFHLPFVHLQHPLISPPPST